MKRFLQIVLLLVIAVLIYSRLGKKSGPPDLASGPAQEGTNRAPIPHGENTFIPIRSYALMARVLSVCAYPPGSDEGAEVSPYDLALGWGPFAEKPFADAVSISQGGRFAYWNASSSLRHFDQIVGSMSNNHIIPANDAILHQIETLKPGEIVQLRGSLLQIRKKGQIVWESSVRRDDTGDGACEVFYVESLKRGSKVDPLPAEAPGPWRILASRMADDLFLSEWNDWLHQRFLAGAPTQKQQPTNRPPASGMIQVVSSRPVSVTDSQRVAVRKYPALAQPGSALNALYVRRYREMRVKQPAKLQNPAWPLLLADETDAALRRRANNEE